MTDTGSRRTVIGQLGRFVVSGVGATAVDLAALNVLMLAFPPEQHAFGPDTYVVLKSCSFVAAATFAYFANKYFTFRVRQSARVREVGRFGLVAAVGFAVNVLLPTVFFGMLSNAALFDPLVRANVASMMGTCVSLVVNFVGYKRFVFKA